MDKEEKYFTLCFFVSATLGFVFISRSIFGAIGAGLSGAIVTWLMYKLFIKIYGLFKKVIVG